MTDQDPTRYTSYTTDWKTLQALRNELSKDRPDIARDTRINGGQYRGAYGGESIVVDREKYPEGFNQAYGEVLRRATDDKGVIHKDWVLQSVFDVTREVLPYDQEVVDRVFRDVADGIDGQKVALDTYLAAGGGVCRHQALLGASLLEKLCDEGVLGGHVSVDRNALKNYQDGWDGHAWIRYTNSAGKVFILDPAQDRIGELDDLMKRVHNDREAGLWDYARDEDIRKSMEEGLAKAAVAAAGQRTRDEYLEPYKDSNGIIVRVPGMGDE